MNLETILFLIGGLVFLVIGGELLVRGASRLASALGVAPIVIGLTVVAFGTSTPDLAVSLKAALAGNADISISNVVGSNIFNVLFILGVSALISPLIIHSQMIAREVPIMIATSILLALFSIGGTIQRWEGMVLFAGIIFYTTWLVLEAKKKRSENLELERESEQEYGSLKTEKKPLALSIAFIVIGLGVVMLGADWLVDGAVTLAKTLGVSDTVIGLTIVAAGTSLPEVVASIMATIKGERDIAVGNVVGSNIYNILAIVGISGTIVPGGLAVNTTMMNFDIPVMVGVALICWPFFKTGNRISRFEGVIFLAAYIAYTGYLITQAA
jgi:cation:H+ antiporter